MLQRRPVESCYRDLPLLHAQKIMTAPDLVTLKQLDMQLKHEYEKQYDDMIIETHDPASLEELLNPFQAVVEAGDQHEQVVNEHMFVPLKVLKKRCALQSKIAAHIEVPIVTAGQGTDILETWASANIMHPYPTAYEKQALAATSGWTMTQVNDWFCNFRKRKWQTALFFSFLAAM